MGGMNTKTLLKSKTAKAVLTQQHSTNTAALSFVVGEIDSTNNNRVQILPDGYFKPTDGRHVDVEGGQWLMDAAAFANIQAQVALRTNDFHFDYEHQTLYSEENGKPAPAAGWFKQLDYVPGEGLFAVDVDWTKPAAQYLANKEYRYTSAVFTYDTKTGRPIQLMHVGLTNDPALDGMKAIAALKSHALNTENLTKQMNGNSANNSTGETPMNEALQILLGLLGVAVEGEDLTQAAILKAAKARATTAITALKTKADESGQLATDLNLAQSSVTALKAKANGEVDLSAFVPKATYDAAVTQLATLKADGDKNSVEQLLKDNKDKVLVSEVDYLTAFGQQQGYAALKTMVDTRPAIAALKGTQTQGKKTPDENVAALTTEEVYTADQLGISHADFLTHKKAHKTSQSNMENK